MTSLDLRNIASAGGNLVVNADKFTALDLKTLLQVELALSANSPLKKQENLLN